MTELALRLRLQRAEDFCLELNTVLPLDRACAIYGDSGSGKTTLLYCLAGLLRADGDSELLFADRPWQQGGQFLPAHKRRVGLVFQDARLFPHLDVAGNLAFAEKRRKGSNGPSRDQVCQWLQLDDLMSRPSDQLSAGQRQRVAIARALLSGPELLLLDEPLANVDHASRRQILHHLEQLQRESGIPIIYVSHEMEEIARLADWLLVLEKGRAVAQGPLLELSSQLELNLAHEEQAAAIVSADIHAHDSEFGLTELRCEGQALFVSALPSSAGGKRRLRIPARDVSLCLDRPPQSTILNILQATIIEIEAGSSSRLLVRLQVGSQYLLARLTRRSVVQLRLAPGMMVYAQVKSVALLSDA
jgi:molybdate transport system ATP-binding protein